MMLPNFLVIGAMKSGTTSLHRYVGSHPDVFVPPIKEIRFFSDDENWERGADWYKAHFRVADSAKAVGEATPLYTMYPHIPHVPKRIASVIPDVRMIYLLRHPIERMKSHYAHMVLKGREQRTIEKALLEEPLYLDLSRYWFQIERYLEWFAPEQILVITSEDLLSSRVSTMREVFRFLGVSPEVEAVTFDKEFHQTTEIRRWHPIARWVRALPGARAAARLLPSPAKSTVTRLASQVAVAEAALELRDDVREQLASRIRDDVGLLARFLGPGFRPWDFAPH